MMIRVAVLRPGKTPPGVRPGRPRRTRIWLRCRAVVGPPSGTVSLSAAHRCRDRRSREEPGKRDVDRTIPDLLATLVQSTNVADCTSVDKRGSKTATPRAAPTYLVVSLIEGPPFSVTRGGKAPVQGPTEKTGDREPAANRRPPTRERPLDRE